MVWDEGDFQALIKLPGVKSSRYDFCQFGEIYHKKTKLIYYGWDLDAKARVCKGHHGTCSRTGEKHVLLTGAVECPDDQLHLLPQRCRPRAAPISSAKASEKKRNPMIWRTKLAEPYPFEFCDTVASVLTSHMSDGLSTSTHAVASSLLGMSHGAAAYPARSIERPPREHYLTHFPIHPGCESCQL